MVFDDAISDRLIRNSIDVFVGVVRKLERMKTSIAFLIPHIFSKSSYGSVQRATIPNSAGSLSCTENE